MAASVLEIGGQDWTVWAAPSQDALVAEVKSEQDLAAFPYGLLLWPAAVALARRLADDPDLVRGRRVLELGCGPGLPGLIARRRGGEVTQTDYQDAPLALARLNAQANGVGGITHRTGDWRDFPAMPWFDLVLGSDILYERALHPALRALLPRLLAPGGTVLLSDPLRPAAAEFIDAMGREGWDVAMGVRETVWNSERREIALFTARQHTSPGPAGRSTFSFRKERIKTG